MPSIWRKNGGGDIPEVDEPTWGELMAFGRFMRHREQFLRHAGTFAEEMDDLELLSSLEGKLRRSHHRRHPL